MQGKLRRAGRRGRGRCRLPPGRDAATRGLGLDGKEAGAGRDAAVELEDGPRLPGSRRSHVVGGLGSPRSPPRSSRRGSGSRRATSTSTSDMGRSPTESYSARRGPRPSGAGPGAPPASRRPSTRPASSSWQAPRTRAWRRPAAEPLKTSAGQPVRGPGGPAGAAPTRPCRGRPPKRARRAPLRGGDAATTTRAGGQAAFDTTITWRVGLVWRVVNAGARGPAEELAPGGPGRPAGALLPLYGDPRPSPVTHRNGRAWCCAPSTSWSHGSGLGSGLAGFRHPLLEEQPSYRADRFMKGEGVVVGASGETPCVSKRHRGGRGRLPDRRGAGGDYRVRMLLSGDPAARRNRDPALGRGDAGEGLDRAAAAPQPAWADAGTVHLDPGAYSATVLLPKGAPRVRRVRSPLPEPHRAPGRMEGHRARHHRRRGGDAS